MNFLTAPANAALFVLVGLESQSAVRGLSTVGRARGVLMVAGISAVIVGVRFGWFFTSPYVNRALDTIVRLRDQGEIDDEVMLRLQDNLDLEAVHLDQHRPG